MHSHLGTVSQTTHTQIFISGTQGQEQVVSEVSFKRRSIGCELLELDCLFVRGPLGLTVTASCGLVTTDALQHQKLKLSLEGV